jgi:hypothetical protein
MKKLLLFGTVFLSLTLIGCSQKEGDKEENDMENISTETTGLKSPSRGIGVEKEGAGLERAETTFMERIQEGKIILLTKKSDQDAFELGGSEISAMTLPDGKLHQVIKDGDDTIINVPGKGELQIIKLNDKFYLFDDNDQAYEVKFKNNMLYAEATSLTDVLLASE